MLFPLLALLGFGGGLDGVAVWIEKLIAHVGITMNIYTIGLLLVTMIVLQHGFFLIQAWIAAGLHASLAAGWRQQITDALLKSEWLYFTRNSTGELSHVLTVETGRAAYLIYYATQIVSLSLTALVYFLVAFIASWKVTLVLLLGGAAILGLSQLLVRHPARVSARQTELYARYAAKSSEALGGMKLIRAMGGDDAIRRSLWPIIHALRQVEQKILAYPAILRSSFEIAAVIALMGTLVLATNVLGSDGATVLLIAALFMRLYPRIQAIQHVTHQFRIAVPYYGAVVDTLDAAKAAAERHVTQHPVADRKATPPTLDIDGLSVSYGERPALHHVNLTIPSRQTVAVVGPSGAGKSTLVDTLLRLVPIQSGRITIDGTDLNDIDLAAWRRSIGYVPQDTFLFNTTIRENIAFAQSDATIAEVQEAARKAHLAAFIETLPEGFDTIVGDRGVRLSGGQRQRVGLARALLGGKTLLILDEATSALDSETEAAIMEDIASLRGQITIIIIAHRLSTLRSADKIFVLDQGQVVESGNWQTLTARGGLFQKLWDMQTEIPPLTGDVRQAAVIPGSR